MHICILTARQVADGPSLAGLVLVDSKGGGFACERPLVSSRLALSDVFMALHSIGPRC